MAIISEAFGPFLAESGPNDRREAIVIYKTPEPARAMRERRKKRMNPRQKRRYLSDLAQIQAPVQLASLRKYRKAGKARLPKSDPRDLETSTSGEMEGAMPFAYVQVTRKTLTALRQSKNIAAVIPNQRIHLLEPREIDYQVLRSQEQAAGMTWGLERLDIPGVWAAGNTRGSGIRVAVLDTGVYDQHPALTGKVADFIVVDPLGNRVTTGTRFDGGSHGTHVCGTIAGGKDRNGVDIGVAPGADLLVGGVLIGDATLRTLVEGIAWAVQQGADIISMSLGFTYYEPQFELLFQQLINLYGILPVVAIGNENHGNTSSPGSAPSALSVGATEKMSSTRTDVAFFSSGASLSFPGATIPLVTKPDVCAPGVQVYSSIPPQQTSSGIYEYTYMDGTSMATPHVAGVAALLMAAKPNADATDIADALRDTAYHPGGNARRPDNRWGWGEIRPVDALAAL